MQQYDPLYHLKVDPKDVSHNEYMETKALYEEYFGELNEIASHSKVHFAEHLLPAHDETGRNFTFCVYERELYIGLYDKNTHSISFECDIDDLKHITRPVIDAAIERMENVTSRHLDIGKSLMEAWEVGIIKAKEEQLSNLDHSSVNDKIKCAKEISAMMSEFHHPASIERLERNAGVR